MQCLAVWLCGLWLSASLAAQSQPDPPAALVVTAPSRPVFVGERVAITLQLELDAAFLAERAVPLFQQPLDLPVAVEAAWLAADEQHQVLVDERAGGRSMATGGARRLWRPVDGPPGRHRFALAVEYLPLAPGRHELQAAVRYAFATAFTEHFLRGREPVDRREAHNPAAGVTLVVEPVPEAGRPTAWSGLVGRGAVRASCAVAEVALGSTLTVVLHCTGRLSAVPAVRAPWPELPGFVVQGCVEGTTATERTFAYDLLVVRAAATAVPPVPLLVFDPETRSFATLVSAPLPLQVVAPAAPLSEPIAALVAADAAAQRAAAAWPGWVHAALAGAALLLVMAVRQLQREGRRRPARAAAVAHLAEALAGTPEAAAAAFAALLRLGPDLAAVPPPLAAELARCREQLEAARFGGPRPEVAWVLAQGRSFAAVRAR